VTKLQPEQARMDPRNQFCHNAECPARGQTGQGNITIHSRREQRYKCARCGKTFAATTGTALYRLHKPTDLFVLVVTLLCHGCPPQAIVAAFGLDERTVAAWLATAGGHSAGGMSTWSRPGRCRSGTSRRMNCG